MSLLSTSRKSNILKDMIAVLAFAIVSVAMLYENNWIRHLDVDDSGYQLYAFQMIYQAIQTGEIPFWMPNIWGGLPGINSITISLSPIAYLFVLLFQDPNISFVGYQPVEAMLIFHIWISQIGLYAIQRQMNPCI